VYKKEKERLLKVIYDFFEKVLVETNGSAENLNVHVVLIQKGAPYKE
jgi:hypothetical protein